MSDNATATQAKSYRAVLESFEEIAPQTRVFRLRLTPGHGLVFQPGQFISLGLPAAEKPIVRAYSIASDPDEPERIEICLNIVPGGPGSTYLFELAVGSEINFTGPWGSFVLGTPAPRSSVSLAIGIGVVPLRPMIRTALRSAEIEELRLIHVALDERTFLYRDEFERLARQDRRFRFEALVADAEDSASRLQALLRERYIDGDASRARHFFICGVGDIVTALRDQLRQAGYERRAVHYEKW